MMKLKVYVIGHLTTKTNWEDDKTIMETSMLSWWVHVEEAKHKGENRKRGKYEIIEQYTRARVEVEKPESFIYHTTNLSTKKQFLPITHFPSSDSQ